ncbi:MAG: Ni/Fe-hydrogenase cytochrome b subunit [Armatimonadota bacterium]|nr:Ni/Fe-hydrogenase cytochrome b subunit [Armatimonadota bacterium]
MKLTPGKAILLALILLGATVTGVRFARGLGAVTHLSDRFPWGLWVGFDVLVGVALAAGGFTMAAAVYVFNLKRFEPLLRPAILTAFLGYILVILALLVDLGRPYRIWHPMIMWNPRSVMFEVAWCVMLYTTVLALEFSPAVFERLRMERPRKIIRAVTVPLVIAGVILSTLHQSSLGALFLIVPEKLHPLWYTPLLPILFFVSALAVAPAMVILEALVSARAYRRQPEGELLGELASVIPVILGIYLLLKLYALGTGGSITWVFAGTVESMMYWLELLLGVVLPAFLLAIPDVRRSVRGLLWSSSLVVLGVVLNRLNVAIIGMWAAAGTRYLPSWMEVAITAGIVALGIFLYTVAVEHLPIFPEQRLRLVQQER